MMGKRKIVSKQSEPQTASALPKRETKNPPPPPPPGTMIPAAALEMFLRATNPNVDWSATIASLGQIAGTVATVTSTAPTATAPLATAPPTIVSPTTTPQTTTKIILAKTSPHKSTPTTDQETSQPSPGQTLTNPLDISPISVYKALEMRTGAGDEEKVDEGRTTETKEGDENVRDRVEGDKEEEVETGATQEEEKARDGKTFEERKLNKMARKQSLMTDGEFEALLEGAQRIGHASPAEEGGIEREPASEPIDLPIQPEERVEQD